MTDKRKEQIEALEHLYNHGDDPLFRAFHRVNLESLLEDLRGEQPQYVPYQKCPKCDGQGTVMKPPYIAGDVYKWDQSTSANFECNVCNGAKVILMALQPSKN